MAFRRQPSNPNPYPFANQQPQQQNSQSQSQQDDSSSSPNNQQSRKRPRAASDVGDSQPDPFHHENGSDASDASDDPGTKPDKKAGRRKIKIEFIQDKSRRHITFSKRKAGIMKKAYELSTLTGTQVLLLVVSETGLVYTFTTAKLQPLVTQPEGKNLIQACLNAPHSSMPSSLPVGSPIGRASNSSAASAGGVGMGSGPSAPGRNVPGGLAIAGDKDSDQDHPPPDPSDHPDSTQQRPDDPDSAAPPASRQARRPSNAPPPKDSPPQAHRKPSPSLLPLQYPPTTYPSQGIGLGVGALDPGMYGHHAPTQPHPQYLPQQPAQAQGPAAPYMAGAPQSQWQSGQTGYPRR